MADYLLDTNVLARCLRGITDTLAMTRTLTNEGDLHISTLSRLEILAEAPAREEKRTFDFLAPFMQLPLNEDIAEFAARLVRETTPPLNLSDAIIAATAVRHDLTLVTCTPNQFAAVSELRTYPLPLSASPKSNLAR